MRYVSLDINDGTSQLGFGAPEIDGLDFFGQVGGFVEYILGVESEKGTSSHHTSSTERTP